LPEQRSQHGGKGGRRCGVSQLALLNHVQVRFCVDHLGGVIAQVLECRIERSGAAKMFEHQVHGCVVARPNGGLGKLDKSHAFADAHAGDWRVTRRIDIALRPGDSGASVL
jgi:hypothetical protein